MYCQECQECISDPFLPTDSDPFLPTDSDPFLPTDSDSFLTKNAKNAFLAVPHVLENPVGLFCLNVGLFCLNVGLFCLNVGPKNAVLGSTLCTT